MISSVLVISYSRLRDLQSVLEAFKDTVTDICAFGTHSLRSGLATNATNACVPDRLFKRHGRWSSEFARDMSRNARIGENGRNGN